MGVVVADVEWEVVHGGGREWWSSGVVEFWSGGLSGGGGLEGQGFGFAMGV